MADAGSTTRTPPAVKDIRITTQDELPGPDGDEPYDTFVNQTEYGNARFLRTNVLSARPDLKKYTALRFQQDVTRPEFARDFRFSKVIVCFFGTD